LYAGVRKGSILSRKIETGVHNAYQGKKKKPGRGNRPGNKSGDTLRRTSGRLSSMELIKKSGEGTKKYGQHQKDWRLGFLQQILSRRSQGIPAQGGGGVSGKKKENIRTRVEGAVHREGAFRLPCPVSEEGSIRGRK